MKWIPVTSPIVNASCTCAHTYCQNTVRALDSSYSTG